MLDYKKTLRHLCSVMSVSGCEREAAREITEEYGKYFDSVSVDAARNIILVKKSKKKNAKKIMLDAHFDQIGMIVNGITSEGLLTVAPAGGLDRVILPSAQVLVYGKETVYGVIAAIPLFLIWLNFSWQIIIYGAQLSYSYENVHKYNIPEWDTENKQ